jgi:hypothetical protein
MSDLILQALMMRLGAMPTGNTDASQLAQSVRGGAVQNTPNFNLQARLEQLLQMIPEPYRPQVRAQLGMGAGQGPQFLGPPTWDQSTGAIPSGIPIPPFQPPMMRSF